MKTLSQYFKFEPLRTKENTIKKYRENCKDNNFPIGDYKLPSNFSYVGLEVEVESLPRDIDILAESNLCRETWYVKKDGSLRNNGLEFVSNPIRGSNLIFAVLELENFLKTKAPQHKFSDRTSIHVHLNVRNLTEEELYKLILLYVITEPLFYRFVELYSVDRKNNVFCVPVQQFLLSFFGAFSEVSGNFSEKILAFSEGWQKYSGLNLLPVHSFGTVEFRQLGGTIDPRVILSWVSLIQRLKIAAAQVSLDWIKETVLTLNTNSHYTHFVETVFGGLHQKFRVYDYQKYLELGVSLNKAFMMPAQKIEITEESMEKAEKSYFNQVHTKVYTYSLGDMKTKMKKQKTNLDITIDEVVDDFRGRIRGEQPVNPPRTLQELALHAEIAEAERERMREEELPEEPNHLRFPPR